MANNLLRHPHEFDEIQLPNFHSKGLRPTKIILKSSQLPKPFIKKNGLESSNKIDHGTFLFNLNEIYLDDKQEEISELELIPPKEGITTHVFIHANDGKFEEWMNGDFTHYFFNNDKVLFGKDIFEARASAPAQNDPVPLICLRQM